MILDNNLVVSGSVSGTATSPSLTGQAITASAVSTNTVDLTNLRDIGEGGEDLILRILVTTANFATLTSLTIDAIVTDAADLTGNVTVIGSTGTLLRTDGSLNLGERYNVRLNPRLAALARTGRRYLGVRYTVGGSNATAGAIFADFGVGVQDGLKFYSSGYSIL